MDVSSSSHSPGSYLGGLTSTLEVEVGVESTPGHRRYSMASKGDTALYLHPMIISLLLLNWLNNAHGKMDWILRDQTVGSS